MRRDLSIMLLIATCFMYLIPSRSIQAMSYQDIKEECHCEVATQPSDVMITIDYEALDELIKNSEGIPMLYVEGNSPIITIEQNKKAASKINKFYNEAKKDFAKDVLDYTEMAEKDYSRRTKEQKKFWHGYSLGTKYTTGRVDHRVISFIQNNYEYTGGAHPNATRFGQTFDAQTGKRLTLKDITTDLAEATKSINAYILNETKKGEYKDYLFEDYEKHIHDILTENTWYFSDKGLVIIANEYIITPHVVGILEFTIPYSELSFIKPEYLPQ